MINYIDEQLKHYTLRKTVSIIVGYIFIGVILLGCTETNDKAKNSQVSNAIQLRSPTGHLLSFDQGSILIASLNHMLKLELVGSKIDPIVVDTDEVNEEQKTTLGKFKKVIYSNAWPGIDVMYEAKPGSIAKSTYTIQNNISKKAISKIRIRYNRPLRLDASGQLVIAYEQGEMIESEPIAWQEIDGKHKKIEVAYNLHSEKELGFKVGDYDPAYPLVIDPTITWNTFLGGTGNDQCNAIAVDGSGDVVLAGSSNASWGSPIRGYTQWQDAFVAKLDSDGTLIWHTFLGGSGDDYGRGITLDLSGNMLVCGWSNSSWGTPINVYASGGDGFIAKLASNGTLIWNTFLGGSGNDDCNDINLDNTGNVLVCGRSTATWGSPVSLYTSGYDAFVAKLASNGTMIWNTFLGGSGSDSGNAVHAGGSDNVYVVGYSAASWGTPIRGYTNGNDAITVKLDNNGALIWNTFLGGFGADAGQAIAVDGSDNVFVAGESSANWGTPIRSYGASIDAFVAKLASNGNIIWTTFLGGLGADYGRAISTDPSDNLAVGGYSFTSWGIPDRAYVSASDGYAAKLGNDGSLIWNTFLGSSGGDFSYSIVIANSGSIYAGGNSDATWELPIRAYTSGNDGFLVKLFDPSPTPTHTATYTPTFTPTPTMTVTTTMSATPIVTNIDTVTATLTPTYTGTPTLTPSQTNFILEPLLSGFIIYPNPFRAPSQKVTIQYVLNQDADVTITIYTYLGVKVKTISIRAGEEGGRGNLQGYTNQVTWDGRNNQGLLQATGGYICQTVAKTKDGKKQEKASIKIGLIR